MKRIFFLFATLACGSALAQPIPLYQNFGTVTNAVQIDALAFDNHGTFDISSQLPYDMQNVFNFTNSGLMSAAGGFKFDTVTYQNGSGGRRPAANFINSGTVTSDSFFGGFFFGNFIGLSQSAYIFVSSTNIDNSNGTLAVGSPGLLSLKGRDTDLTRSALIAGDPFSGGGGGFGGFIRVAGTNYYTLPSDVSDIYGGAGVQTNNLTTSFGLLPPDVSSPLHQVFFPGGDTNGTSISLPQTSPAQFDAFANVTNAGGDKLVQVVFVKTNFLDTNISVAVTFGNFPFFNLRDSISAPAAIVKINSTSFDPISGGISTNTITFIDSAARQTNLVLYTNFNARQNVRPSNYQITTANLAGFGNNEAPGNTPYAPTLIYDPAIHSSNIVVGFYGGYGAQVGSGQTASGGSVHPTNQSPRIEINSDNLDLTLARLRSEGPILINTKHLIGNEGSAISAGLLRADIGSTNGLLRISNLFPESFQRLRGEIYAYSYLWENVETDPVAGTTNNVKYHILILDHEFTANLMPSVESLILRANNLIIEDDLKLDRTIQFVGPNLTFNSAITINNFDLRSTNFVGTRNFTNETNAIFSGADSVSLGYDLPNGLVNIVNKGQISAGAALFRSDTFFNSGLIGPGTNNLFVSTGGNTVIQARTVTLSGGTMEAGTILSISAGSLVVTNSLITVGGLDGLTNFLFGRLILNVTNLISDFGVGANNVWEVSNGFELQRKPVQGDLLGTEIRTIASANREVRHIWAGRDVGPGPDGFVNNAAIGHLILDIQSANAKLRFSPSAAGSRSALYVVDLDVNFGAGIDTDTSLNRLIAIDENMRIYYINSNAGDKLMNAFPDRVFQVENFDLLAGATPLVVTVNGLGIVTPNLNGKNLEVGREYKMRAIPGAGQIFTGWSGGTNASSTLLKFKMRRGLVIQANNGPNPIDGVKGAYNGVYYETNGVRHESSGFVNFNVTKKGVVTGKIISGKTYRFKGNFDPSSGYAEIPVKRLGKSTLALALQLDLQNGSDEVAGTVDADGWTAILRGDLANTRPSFLANKARYTMAISGIANAADGPGGTGFGTIQVNAAGGVLFSGKLADGTKFNQRIPVSKNGQVPFYLPLYQGSGSLLSWIQFTNDTLSSLSGDVTWIKKAASKGIYQAGFTNLGNIAGSSYFPPTANARIVEIIEGTVILSGGNLNTSQSNIVALGTDNVATILTGENQLKFTFSLPTGLLGGSFIHPDTQKKTSIQGVVLQQQQDVRGYFLGTNQTGAVLLQNN